MIFVEKAAISVKVHLNDVVGRFDRRGNERVWRVLAQDPKLFGCKPAFFTFSHQKNKIHSYFLEPLYENFVSKCFFIDLDSFGWIHGLDSTYGYANAACQSTHSCYLHSSTVRQT